LWGSVGEMIVGLIKPIPEQTCCTISTECSSILEILMSGMPDKFSFELRRLLHTSKKFQVSRVTEHLVEIAKYSANH
jgi:hypothetical protein